MKFPLHAATILAVSIALAGCESMDAKGLADSITKGADTYANVAGSEKSAETTTEASTQQTVDANTGSTKANTEARPLNTKDSLPSVINLEGATYVRTDGNFSGGFRYRNAAYAPSSQSRKGANFVRGDQSSGTGFWQNGSYWVPSNDASKPVATSTVPDVINLGNETYINIGTQNPPRGGFRFMGNSFALSADYLDGITFREGNQNAGNGFWQNGRYWVRGE